jgi:hypothetical protein
MDLRNQQSRTSTPRSLSSGATYIDPRRNITRQIGNGVGHKYNNRAVFSTRFAHKWRVVAAEARIPAEAVMCSTFRAATATTQSLLSLSHATACARCLYFTPSASSAQRLQLGHYSDYPQL